MWAAPPTSFTRNDSLSTAGATTVSVRLPPQRCRVSFAFSRWPENCCRDTHVGVVGRVAALTAFKSKAQQQQKLKPSSSSSSSSSPGVRVKGPSSNKKQEDQQDKTAKQEAKKGGDEERRQLSGSDVLWALQRASAEKAKKYQQQQQRQKRCNANQPENEMRRAVEADDARSTTNAGPHWPRIQSDWGFRLEALEKRLEELLLLDV